jgi:hypothetical protein
MLAALIVKGLIKERAMSKVTARDIKKELVFIGTVLLLGAALAIPAYAGPSCGPRKEIVADLGQQFREAPIALGLSSDGTVVEVLTTENGSTWTIMVSRPDGVSCLVAAGESWQELKRKGRELGT